MTRQKQLTADGIVTSAPGKLKGVLAILDGTNNLTIRVYDNTAASGNDLIPSMVIPTSATVRSTYIPFPDVQFFNGMYLDLTLSGGAATVCFYYDND